MRVNRAVELFQNRLNHEGQRSLQCEDISRYPTSPPLPGHLPGNWLVVSLSANGSDTFKVPVAWVTGGTGINISVKIKDMEHERPNESATPPWFLRRGSLEILV